MSKTRVAESERAWNRRHFVYTAYYGGQVYSTLIVTIATVPHKLNRSIRQNNHSRPSLLTKTLQSLYTSSSTPPSSMLLNYHRMHRHDFRAGQGITLLPQRRGTQQRRQLSLLCDNRFRREENRFSSSLLIRLGSMIKMSSPARPFLTDTPVLATSAGLCALGSKSLQNPGSRAALARGLDIYHTDSSDKNPKRVRKQFGCTRGAPVR